MSQNPENLPAVVSCADMTVSQVEKVKKFIDDGLPGITEVTNHQLTQMLDLYLTGSSYTQIANILRIKQLYVLYFAYTANWEGIRAEYLNEIQESIKNRLVSTKLRNKEFMLLLSQAYQRKIGTQLQRFLSTGLLSDIDEVKGKEVLMLMKIIELTNSLDEEGKDKNGKMPTIGLNAGANGVVVERISDSQLSITPKDKDESVGNLLKKLAEEKRAKEKAFLVQEIKKEPNNENE